jgi:hypothetical protein
VKQLSPAKTEIAWEDASFGPLPVEAIEKALGLKLKAGTVVFYAHAQKHAFKKKPDRYDICWKHITTAVSNPTHVGQQPGYEQKGFDLVCQIPSGPIVLVAIRLKPKKGIYAMKSAYPLPPHSLARRIRVGTTKRA